MNKILVVTLKDPKNIHFVLNNFPSPYAISYHNEQAVFHVLFLIAIIFIKLINFKHYIVQGHLGIESMIFSPLYG